MRRIWGFGACGSGSYARIKIIHEMVPNPRYGRRITILILRVLIVTRMPHFLRSMRIIKIVSPPAGTVPVHAERVSLGAPDSPPNGIPDLLGSLVIKG